MSDASLTREQWATVLDEASPATFGELVATLENRDFVPNDPSALVEDAITDGPLVEDEDVDGSFAVYRLDTEENDAFAIEDPGLSDATPGGETDEPASSDTDTSGPADGGDWAAILDAVDGPPTVNRVIQFLADADMVSLSEADAADVVEQALEDGALKQNEDGPGMFPVLTVTGRDPPEQVTDEPIEPAPEQDLLRDQAHDALEDAVEFFHSRLDDPLPESCDIEATTPREYLHNRGWDDETIDEYQLGYAPASDTALLEYLMRQDHDREAMLGTGLFYESLEPHFYGRIVFPYCKDDRPVYAISRSLEHPSDPKDGQKYTKAVKTKEYSFVDEPIFGLDSIEPGRPVVITEGIADAITAQTAGYPTVSPVTTRFKHDDREALVEALSEYEIPRVYIVQDAEAPSTDLTEESEGWDALTIEQYGEGLRGAVDTGAYLNDHGIEAYVAELPRPGLDKVDVDDYLQEWGDGDLGPVLASAKPATLHDAYDAKEFALEQAQHTTDRETVESSDTSSAVYDLSILDVAGIDSSYRGPNPLGHHGDSENYYIVYERGGDLLGFDHKYQASYNGLTHLLVEAGERSADSPNGRLDDGEHFAAWQEAKNQGLIPSDDAVPYRGLCHIVREHELAPAETIPSAGNSDGSLPADAYNEALEVIEDEYGLDPGRDPVTGGRGNPQQYDVDPLSLDIVIDISLAHRAVQQCHPADLADDAQGFDDIRTVPGEGWAPPDGADVRVNVVRATLLSEGLIDAWDADLDSETWSQGYRLARERYGAPLPEYVNHTVATDNWATIEGAVEALRGWHVRDGMDRHVTVEDPSDPDAVAVYDFEDSKSGERLVEFESGLYYCREHEHVVDPLRAVAVQADVIQRCTDALAGEDFQAAYHAAREEYGAPLPEWQAGDPSHTVLLPPADDVLGELAVDADDLHAARKRHEDLLEEMSQDYQTVHLDTSSPGTGKTTGSVRIAVERDEPILYAAPRLELMKEVEMTAREYGGSYYHAPIFSKSNPSEGAVNRGVEKIRELDDGFDLLRNPEDLLEELEMEPEAIEPGDGAKVCGECGEEFATLTAARMHECPQKAEDEITLENPDGTTRAACPTASGPTSDDPDDEEYVWWLRVHIARSLGFTPKEIHVNDEWLFGEELPCHHSDDDVSTCALSQAWERIADPDHPIDVLIGHYVHSHVESARTYYYTDEDDNTATKPRTVAIDEFPSDAYGVEFGEEAVEHARWLAQSLREDVQSTQDMWEADPALGDDDHLNAWLEGEADNPDRWQDAADLAAALDELHSVTDALEAVQEFADDHAERLAPDHPQLSDALTAVSHGPGVVGGDTLVERVEVLDSALETADLPEHLDEELSDALGSLSGGLFTVGVTTDASGSDTIAEACSNRPEPFHGDLADLIDRAITALANGDDGAEALVWSAKQAVTGGEEGCRELAAHARDGYAHPLAIYLLAGAVRDGEVIETPSFEFDLPDGEAGDGDIITQVELDRSTVLWSREHNGALVNHPPTFTSGGLDCSVIGLDATGRKELWELALGRRVTPESVHSSTEDKRRFLRDVMNLQVVQTSRRLRTYEGAPSGSFDGDVGLVRKVSQEYTQQFLREGRLDRATKPGVITTKTVREQIEDRLEDDVSAIDHYGNILGSNELAQCNVGVVLGTQHFGDEEVEMWAALGGEEVARSGRGNDLSYGSEIGDQFLKHMTEDQTLQAIMRFGRDEAGAVVFAHTSALREDLPVVGSGAVVRSYSQTGRAVAQTLQSLRDQEFTRSDVEDQMNADVSSRQVRRILKEFVKAGYLDREDRAGPRGAHQYDVGEMPDGPTDAVLPTPGLPDQEEPPDQADGHPNRVVYTADVRLELGGDIRSDRSQTVRTTIAAPDAPIELAPPGKAG